MINLNYTDEERSKFKVVFTQEDALDSRIQRPDVIDGKANTRANILFKDFRVIYKKNGDLYDESNTTLIDDSSIQWRQLMERST